MCENKKINKFRGIPVGGGEFVYGSLVLAADGVFIIEDGTRMRFEEPEFHKSGMGCGLEDRGITDRYEAMAHGWDRAMKKCAEFYPGMVEIDPQTVGEFTGLSDKIGCEIYEEDILLGPSNMNYRFGNQGKVQFDSDCAGFMVRSLLRKELTEWGGLKDGDRIRLRETLTCDVAVDCEIIGNIHVKIIPV